MTKQQILEEIQTSPLPVIICGAGIVGEILLALCRQQGIRVECFCDNSIKVAQSPFCGLEVIHTPELKSRYADALFLISVAAIQDVVDRLRELGYSHWYAGGMLLKDMDHAQSGYGPIDYPRFAVENCILCHNGYLDQQRLFFRSIDLIITERCSLRCKDCSNLMQYYNRPRNCDTEMLLRSMDAFFTLVDEVMDFRIIGGDAFMSKEWPVIVKRVAEEPAARRIVLYTNGTIVPDENRLASLRNGKSLVIMTDYGTLSRRITELKETLNRMGIPYHVLEIDSWLDCAAIVPHHRTRRQQMELFKDCCAKNMPTLSDGKLFRCPYSANAYRLGAVPENYHDYIDLFQEPLAGKELVQTKERVREFLVDTPFLDTCDYCNGRPLSGVEVKPAVQAAHPLPYRRYAHRQPETCRTAP